MRKREAIEKMLYKGYGPWLLRCIAPSITISANLVISSSISPDNYANIAYFVTLYTLIGSSLFGGISSAALRFLNYKSPIVKIYNELRLRKFGFISYYTGINIILALAIPVILNYPKPIYLTIAIIGAGMVTTSSNIERANNNVFQMALNLNIYALIAVGVFTLSVLSNGINKISIDMQIKLTSILILALGTILLQRAMSKNYKLGSNDGIEEITKKENRTLMKYMQSTQVYQLLGNATELTMPIILFNFIGPTIYAYFALAQNIVFKPMAFLGSQINVYLSTLIYENYDTKGTLKIISQERKIACIYIPLTTLTYAGFLIFCLMTEYKASINILWLPTLILMFCPILTFIQHRCTQRLSAMKRVERLIPISIAGSITQVIYIGVLYKLKTLSYFSLAFAMLASGIVMAIMAYSYVKNTKR